MEGLYEQRGVSATKAEVHKAISGLSKGLYANTFCKVLPDTLTGSSQHCLLMHADTAGTKTALAYIHWRETGDLTVWKGIVQDAVVMNLDDLACTGVRTDILLSSTIGRNKKLIPGEVVQALIEGTVELLEFFTQHGISVTLAGGETADVGDIVRTVDVGFTATARLARSQVKQLNIQPGDVLVGFASFGQASYEPSRNSGIGSNGLTYARHEVLASSYAQRYPESYDPQLAATVVYQGKAHLQDVVQGAEATVAQLLLSPTRTYLPLLAKVPEKLWTRASGLIHCTGGGQTKVLHFIKGVKVVKDNLFIPPPVFQLIQQQRGAAWQELYQVFNMGHRLEVYCSPEDAPEWIALAASLNLQAQLIGHVEAYPDKGGKEVQLTHPITQEVYTYY